MREFTLENVLKYIDEAIERQKFDGTWLDDQYDKHTTDVGYVCEGLEIMKNELIRTFANKNIDMNYDGKMLETRHIYQVGEKYYYFDADGKLNETAHGIIITENSHSGELNITPEVLKIFNDKIEAELNK